jgi:hypothetical protein
MGLMQLLTVGRSLDRISDEPSRYKMTQQTLLPKFGSVNAPENRARGVSETTNPVIAPAAAGKAKAESATARNDRKKMNAVQPEMERKVAPEGVAPKPAFPRGRWTLFRNPFAKVPKPEAATRAPVQSELLLDAVKPVRNDLSDSDLELVQAARRSAEVKVPVPSATPAPASVSPAPAAPEAEPVAADGVVWNRIKNQFFGAGKA